jgi:hypothetical protein
MTRPLRTRMPDSRNKAKWSANFDTARWASIPAVGDPLSMTCAGTGAWVWVSQ